MKPSLSRLGALLISLSVTASAQVSITEFMASNSSTLADENGSFQDWVELENTSAASVNLFNWVLKDSTSTWRFPSKVLAPRQRLIVFASGKDRTNPVNNLHTNFSLSAGGEYLGLLRPDLSVATEFAPGFPTQYQNVSYGFPVQTTTQTLLASGAAVKYLVPSDGTLGTTWTDAAFVDSAWTAGTNGLGYETGGTDPNEDYTFASTVAASAPLGYWRFSETSGTNAVNIGSLGAVENATLLTTATFNAVGPRPADFNGFEAANTGVNLSGATGVLVPDNTAFDFGTGAFAVEMWFYPTNAAGRGDLFTYKGTGGDFGIHLSSQTAGKISVYHNGFIGSAGGAVVNNTWYHLVVTRNVAGTLTAYLNGAAILSGTDTQTMNIANALLFGGNHNGTPTSPGATMAGRIDEAAIYGRELSAAEVFSHYQRAVSVPVSFSSTVPAGVGALGAWRFNEASGTAAANTGSLGAAVNGTIYGLAAFNAVGPRPPAFNGYEATNTAVNLPGSTSQIVVPDHASFDFGTGPFAVEMWFYPTNAAGRGDLFTYKGTGGDFGIHLSSQTAGTISVYHSGFVGSPGGSVVNNMWYHLVVTRNVAGTITAYLNGVAILSGTNTNTMNIANALVFGSNHTGTPTSPSIPFAGRIDEAAIYGREVTASEAQSRYQNALTGLTSHFATDVQSAMYNVNSGVYIRIPFTVANVATVSRLALRMKYDDGFVAYVNGHEILDVNAPASPAWNATATVRNPDSAAIVPREFAFDDAIEWLQPGTNVLAIHALNFSASNYDFLNSSELVATNVTGLSTTAAYLSTPTPGALNVTGAGTPGPVVTSPAFSPAQPTDLQPVVVTARVVPTFGPIGGVTLNYRVMYGSIIQTPMLDDGAHGDGAAGDGVFGATIPDAASTAGQMIRWYITATDNATHTSRLPLFTDPLNSAEYFGTVVQSVTPNIPLWEWFTNDVTSARNATGTRASVFFNGEFYDNVFVRSRGGFTSTGSQKFDFNTGEKCFINAEAGRVDEANLNAPGSDGSYIRPPLAFETYRLAGHPACVAFNTVLRVNGGADRVGYYVEQVDDEFLAARGMDKEGALYKFVQRGSGSPVFTDATDAVEKKTRKFEGNADLQAFVTGLNQADVNARRAWFWDNVNAPSLLNLLALSRITQDADDVRKNFYLYRDTNGNGEWSIFPWDKDWTFGVTGDGPPHLYHPFFGDAAHAKQPGTASPQWNLLWEFVFNDATLQPLAMRRLRTLMDQMLQPPGTVNGLFEQRANATMALLSPNVPGSVSSQIAGVLNFFPQRRTDLYTTYSVASGSPGNQLIPNAQPGVFPVTITAVDFNPASGNQEHEFIQLTNPGAFVADISGWTLAGAVAMTFDPGTVIPAGGSIYASPSAAAFRARTTGPTGGQQLQVQDRYNGQLSARGETIELRDATGALVATQTYTAAPTAAQQQLRITELMFAPTAPTPAESAAIPGVSASEFEFIELQNIGGTPLELNGCHFEKGITFAFTTPTSLPAGGRIILVSNSAAFALRHPGVTVAGVFTGNLDNSGETIQLVDGVGEVVLDFSFDPAWFPPTVAGGRSLVARNAAPDFATYDAPTHWALSGAVGGSPGASDADFANVYEGWRWDHFSNAEVYLPSPPNPAGTVNTVLVGPAADADGDGLNNLGEFAFGKNARAGDNFALSAAGTTTIGADKFLTITFTRRHKALDVTYTIESTDNLSGSWTPTTEQIGTASDLGNGIEQVTFRDTIPQGATLRFIRVRAGKL